MSRRAASTKRALTSAKRSRRIVEVWRKDIDPRPLAGFVLDCDHGLVLLHRLSDSIHLDGYSVLRLSDISRIDARPQHRAFYERALALRREKPRVPRGIDLSGIDRAIATAAQTFPLVTLHREAISRDSCSIGTIRLLTEKSVVLRWLTPGARWDGESPRYRLTDISLLEFGGEYEDALARVAGLRRPAI